MVGPVAYNAQAQIPAANTFQPGTQTGQTKSDAEIKDEKQTRPAGTSAAESQQTETRNTDRNERSLASSDGDRDDSGAVSASATRGSTVDISA